MIIKQKGTFFQGLKEGSKSFGESIGTLINSILLTLVYFIGVGITSLIAKSLGKKFLDLKIDSKKNSYWEDLNIDKKNLEDCYRQF